MSYVIILKKDPICPTRLMKVGERFDSLNDAISAVEEGAHIPMRCIPNSNENFTAYNILAVGSTQEDCLEVAFLKKEKARYNSATILLDENTEKIFNEYFYPDFTSGMSEPYLRCGGNLNLTA